MDNDKENYEQEEEQEELSLASPRISSVGASEDMGGSSRTVEFNQPTQWQPSFGHDHLHWGGVNRRVGQQAHSVASSAATRDDKSIYEEPGLDVTEEGEERAAEDACLTQARSDARDVPLQTEHSNVESTFMGVSASGSPVDATDHLASRGAAGDVSPRQAAAAAMRSTTHDASGSITGAEAGSIAPAGGSMGGLADGLGTDGGSGSVSASGAGGHSIAPSEDNWQGSPRRDGGTSGSFTEQPQLFAQPMETSPLEPAPQPQPSAAAEEAGAEAVAEAVVDAQAAAAFSVSPLLEDSAGEEEEVVEVGEEKLVQVDLEDEEVAEEGQGQESAAAAEQQEQEQQTADSQAVATAAEAGVAEPAHLTAMEAEQPPAAPEAEAPIGASKPSTAEETSSAVPAAGDGEAAAEPAVWAAPAAAAVPAAAALEGEQGGSVGGAPQYHSRFMQQLAASASADEDLTVYSSEPATAAAPDAPEAAEIAQLPEHPPQQAQQAQQAAASPASGSASSPPRSTMQPLEVAAAERRGEADNSAALAAINASGSGSGGGAQAGDGSEAAPRPDLIFPQSWYQTFHGLLYMDGVDALGRPVVVLNADAVPPNMKSSALIYVKAHLEPLVNQGDYVLVFTSSGAAKLPSMWIMGAYRSLPRPFRKHVQYVVLVRPSAFLRAVLGFMRPFFSKKAGRKIKQVQSVHEIAEATGGEVTVQSLGPAFAEEHLAGDDGEGGSP
ncbi:hypothetical protein D9Q98_006709 [Chlorella vulgaris]|uniref:CRAL-TRIO domain-containing protein n=1 Tax=Chlorella vulgaris TaxID=3077 RepID=A0A9D4TKY9_CHLVU|nr:hypothetical protein D9Q98_006709 [Chlorella vulgaris]